MNENKRIIVHRNPKCGRCARIMRFHHAFDWLGRVGDSTAMPPGGALRPGQIEVVDLVNGGSVRGAAAVELISRQIPAYLPLRLLLKIPAFRRRIDRDLSGEADGAASRAQRPRVA
jgi:hypothetical protein